MIHEVSSFHIKSSALCWLRFGRGWKYVATEVGGNSADVFGSDGSKTVEIEVKTSKSDLKADFKNKISKHEKYKDAESLPGELKGHRYPGRGWIPNKMYFAVPVDLKEYALEYIQEQNTRYGVMEYDPKMYLGRALTVTKRAKFLHTRDVEQVVLDSVLSRMGSEVCNWHINQQFESFKENSVRKMMDLYEESDLEG